MAGGEAQLVCEPRGLGQIGTLKLHERAVTQAMVTLALPVALKHRMQLARRNAIRQHGDVDEPRMGRSTYAYLRLCPVRKATEGVGCQHLTQTRQLPHALEDNARHGVVVRPAYQQSSGARCGEVARHHLARSGLAGQVAPQGVVGPRTIEERDAAGTVAGQCVAGHELSRAVEPEAQAQRIGSQRVKLGRDLHLHHALDPRQGGRHKATRVVGIHKQLRRLAGIDLLQERRLCAQPLRAQVEALALQRIGASRRGEDVGGGAADQLVGSITTRCELHAQLWVALDNTHLASARGTRARGRLLKAYRPPHQKLEKLVGFWWRQAQLLAHRLRQARKRIGTSREARARIGAAVLDAAAHEAHQRAVRLVEGLHAMGEAQLAPVLHIGTRRDGRLEVAEVAHHVGSARPMHAKAHEQVVVTHQPHGKAHRSRSFGLVAHDARTRRTTHPVEVGGYDRRGVHVLELVETLVELGVAVKVERQRHAVLARPGEAVRRRAGACIREDLVGRLVDGNGRLVAVRIARRAVHTRHEMGEPALVAAGTLPDSPLSLGYDARAAQDGRAA